MKDNRCNMNNIIPKYPCEKVERVQILLNNQIYPGYSITIISKNNEGY